MFVVNKVGFIFYFRKKIYKMNMIVVRDINFPQKTNGNNT
jgi:hypothetical protein